MPVAQFAQRALKTFYVTLPPEPSPAGMLVFRRFEREQGDVEQASQTRADHLQAA